MWFLTIENIKYELVVAQNENIITFDLVDTSDCKQNKIKSCDRTYRPEKMKDCKNIFSQLIIKFIDKYKVNKLCNSNK